MCTATYLPTATGFILTHSRDEKATRPAARPPQRSRVGGETVVFPQDPQGQGTWIANSVHLTACLLNGAFVAHQPQPPYRHSRGVVVLDAFDYITIDAFIRHYPFAGIEPFTLLLAEPGRLVELRWNGNRLFTKEKDASQPHIWSSVTLYTPDVSIQRERWFRDWQVQHPYPSVDAVRQFHRTAGNGDAHNSLRMNRRAAFGHDALLTLSLTSVVWHTDAVAMLYEDFTQATCTQQTLHPHYATT